MAHPDIQPVGAVDQGQEAQHCVKIIQRLSDPGAPLSIWVDSTWSTISAGARSRTFPAMVDAQNAQPIRQPTWQEMQTVLPC